MSGPRVLAYNIRGFRNGFDQVAAVIDGTHADLVLLTECGPRRRLARLAERTGTRVAHGPLPWLGRPAPRNAVLVRTPWRLRRFRPVVFASDGRYPRGALIAEVDGPDGAGLTVASVHLGLVDGMRPKHATELIGELGDGGRACVVGGDLNEAPDGPVASAFRSGGFRDAWVEAGSGRADGNTYPAHDPTARIDYVLVGVGVEAASCAVVGEAIGAGRPPSDHLAVVADLSVEGASPS